MSWPRLRSDGFPRTHFQQWLAVRKACESGRKRVGNMRPETFWKTWTNPSDMMWMIARLGCTLPLGTRHIWLEGRTGLLVQCAVYAPLLSDKHQCDVIRGLVPSLPPFRNYEFQPWTDKQLRAFAAHLVPTVPPSILDVSPPP